jgi:carbonic anhydrase/acetyltransferase-like protein (isoleucine patch superfamily)
LIGMGAIVLNGARVGANCIVGAGAFLRENAVVPDNTLVVGSPARTVRSLDEAVVRQLEDSADVYVRRGREFAASLRRVE